MNWYPLREKKNPALLGGAVIHARLGVPRVEWPSAGWVCPARSPWPLSFPKIISAHSDGAVRKELAW